MKCQICGCEVHGEIEISETNLSKDDNFEIKVEGVQRNWLCCDSCNRIVCHKCCKHPATGYCDSCLESNNLSEYFRQVGLIA